MRLLHRYIARDVLTTFLMAVLVLCFVLSASFVFKATELIAAGATPGIVLRFIGSSMPEMLTLSIPVALLVSTLLVFGRLSSDSEISAMRACGIPLRTLMATPLAIAAVLSGVCVVLNGTVGPRSNAARRDLRYSVKAADLLSYIRPGKFVDDFPGVTFYAGARDAHDESLLYDVRILEAMGGGRTREVKAARARISMEDARVRLDMEDVTMNPIDRNHPVVGEARHAVYHLGNEKAAKFKARELLDKDSARKRRNVQLHSWTSLELLDALREARESPPDPDDREQRITLARMKTELSRRMVFALACVCFVAIAIPLGIRSQRRESAIGTAVCIALAASFYLFIIAAESLTRGVWLSGYVVAWVPVVLCLSVSAILVSRNP